MPPAWGFDSPLSHQRILINETVDETPAFSIKRRRLFVYKVLTCSRSAAKFLLIKVTPAQLNWKRPSQFTSGLGVIENEVIADAASQIILSEGQNSKKD